MLPLTVQTAALLLAKTSAALEAPAVAETEKLPPVLKVGAAGEA